MANPNIISGQAIGGIITVQDSTQLALLSTQGLPVGSQVFNLGANAYFTLTISPAALVTDQVVAVLGIDGYRWIRGGGGGGGGGGLNPALIFVSPEGDDANDGTTWESAVKTGYHGYSLIVAAGGGTLNLANGVDWVDNNNLKPGQVAGQGAWFRGDPVALVEGGFQPCVTCNIVGWGNGGKAFLQTPFQQPGLATLKVGSNLAADNRTKPGVWLVYCALPMYFHNILAVPSAGHDDGQEGLYCAYRTGWDYNRTEAGDIAYQTIHAASRTGSAGAGTTVYTADLAPAVTIPIGQVHRGPSPNVPGAPVTVQVTYHRTGNVDAPPWGVGAQVWFDTSDVNFTPGAYTVIFSNAFTLASADWGFEFIDGSSSTATSTATSTVRSTVAVPGSLIDVETNNAQFPSTQYPVTAVAATNPTTCTISVTDIYGGYNGITPTASASGMTNSRLVHQERDLYMTIGTRYYNCTSRATQDVNKLFRMGNMFDFGSVTAFNHELHDSYLQGYKPLNGSGIPYDDYRMSAVFLKGGGVTPSGLIATGLTGQQASIRAVLNSTTCQFTLRDVIFDTDNNGQPPAAYVITGDVNVFVSINNVMVVDSNLGFGSALNSITGVPGINIQGDSAVVTGVASVAPSSNAIPGSAGNSPWVDNHVGTWASDLQISGKHPAAWRNISPVTRRFAENIRASASWSPAPVSGGHPDPTGGSAAVRYDDTNAGSPNFQNASIFSFDHTFTFAAGDYLLVSGWVNANATGWPTNVGYIASVAATGTITWDSGGTTWTGQIPFDGPGWQFCSFRHRVASVSGAVNLTINIITPAASSGGTIDLFGWSIQQIPASVAAPNDATEYAGTAHGMPRYLPVAAAGTFENQLLVGHGGLGTAKRYTVGGASGNITLGGANGKAVELFDESGNSLGVAVLQSFTVNP